MSKLKFSVTTKTFSPVEKVARRFSAVTDKGIAACDIDQRKFSVTFVGVGL